MNCRIGESMGCPSKYLYGEIHTEAYIYGLYLYIYPRYAAVETVHPKSEITCMSVFDKAIVQFDIPSVITIYDSKTLYMGVGQKKKIPEVPWEIIT